MSYRSPLIPNPYCSLTMPSNNAISIGLLISGIDLRIGWVFDDGSIGISSKEDDGEWSIRSVWHNYRDAMNSLDLERVGAVYNLKQTEVDGNIYLSVKGVA